MTNERCSAPLGCQARCDNGNVPETDGEPPEPTANSKEDKESRVFEISVGDVIRTSDTGTIEVLELADQELREREDEAREFDRAAFVLAGAAGVATAAAAFASGVGILALVPAASIVVSAITAFIANLGAGTRRVPSDREPDPAAQDLPGGLRKLRDRFAAERRDALADWFPANGS
jgi:hypothetical protein